MSWLIDTLFATGALIALVLVLRRPVARLFGPGMAYALWALPLLRMVLPPLLLPAPEAAEVPVEQVVQIAAEASLPVPSPMMQAVPVGPDWGMLALALWLAGVAVFALWRVWGYLAMRRLLLTDAVPVGQVESVRLVESAATAAPVAFGVRDKVVALPLGFMNRADRLGRDLAIAHELEHHAARDLAVNLAMQPLLALHWFNPLAWLGWRALRRDQEAACDARVIAGAGPELRAAYGRLIAAFAQSPRLALAAPMACPVLGEASVIHRLRSLTMSDLSPRRRLAGRTMIAAALLALPLTASVTYAAADQSEPPAPPAAPEAPAAPTPPAAPSASEGPHHRIVIVEKEGGAYPDDPSLKTRIIQRGGKTIVFKTDKVLTDAEIETKIDQAFASIPDVPDVPPPPAPPAMADWPSPKSPRVVIVNRDSKHPADLAKLSFLEGRKIDCGGDRMVSKVERADGGKAETIAICVDKIEQRALAQAADGLKKARDRIAADSKLSDEIREEILGDLDREIERLSRQGKS